MAAEMTLGIASILAAATEWEAARTEALRIGGGKSANFDHLTRLANAEAELVRAVRAAKSRAQQ